MKEQRSNPFEVAAACGREVSAEVDRVGYQLLAENGYPEALEKNMNNTLRDAIRKKMSKRGERLLVHSRFDGDLGRYVIWFTLNMGRRVLATSRPVTLQGKPLEDGDAEG